MLIKAPDDKTPLITELEQLLATAPADKQKLIQRELNQMRAGFKAEKEAAYLIDFEYGKSEYIAVIHDLRLDIGGRVAQIDHLILNRFLHLFVLETKSARSGIRITEEGEFLRWNSYTRSYEGMASPLAQNERHIMVLKEAFGRIELPRRLGITLVPTCISCVIVPPAVRVIRPKKFDTSQVIQADRLSDALDALVNKQNPYSTLGKIVSAETVMNLARQLASLHKPMQIDYAARFGLQNTPQTVQTAYENFQGGQDTVSTHEPVPLTPDQSAPVCRHCGQASLRILYGRYGYYFKCDACEGNTPIRLQCTDASHKVRLRKQGNQFFSVCPECDRESLYWVNPAD